MIIVKDITDLTAPELLEALQDVAGAAAPINTGHGGFVVPAAVAHTFLGAYLAATGTQAPATTCPHCGASWTDGQGVEDTPDPPTNPPVPERKKMRRSTRGGE